MVYTYDPSTLQAEEKVEMIDLCSYQASLTHTASSRPARETQRKTLSKKKNMQNFEDDDSEKD